MIVHNPCSNMQAFILVLSYLIAVICWFACSAITLINKFTFYTRFTHNLLPSHCWQASLERKHATGALGCNITWPFALNVYIGNILRRQSVDVCSDCVRLRLNVYVRLYLCVCICLCVHMCMPVYFPQYLHCPHLHIIFAMTYCSSTTLQHVLPDIPARFFDVFPLRLAALQDVIHILQFVFKRIIVRVIQMLVYLFCALCVSPICTHVLHWIQFSVRWTRLKRVI